MDRDEYKQRIMAATAAYFGVKRPAKGGLHKKSGVARCDPTHPKLYLAKGGLRQKDTKGLLANVQNLDISNESRQGVLFDVDGWPEPGK